MRYLIDTCIFTHMAIEPDRLSSNVASILGDYDNTICISVESERELIVSFNNREIVSQKHKDPSDHVIISQAITLHIPLISSDGKFEFYRSQGLDFIKN